MKSIAWSAALVLCACGGEAEPAKSAADEYSETPAMKCIKEAETVLKPPADAPERMDLAHILVRHAGVRDAGNVTLTREEACLRALEARKKLLAGGDWDEVFGAYSDAQGAGAGELHDVSRDELEPAFGGAAFSLAVDQLSYVVESRRGFHIIWRKE
jgi:hypothetical protein